MPTVASNKDAERVMRLGVATGGHVVKFSTPLGIVIEGLRLFIEVLRHIN